MSGKGSCRGLSSWRTLRESIQMVTSKLTERESLTVWRQQVALQRNVSELKRANRDKFSLKALLQHSAQTSPQSFYTFICPQIVYNETFFRSRDIRSKNKQTIKRRQSAGFK